TKPRAVIRAAFPQAEVTRVAQSHKTAGGAAMGRPDTANNILRRKNSRVARMTPKIAPATVEVAAPAVANINVGANEDHSVPTISTEECAKRKTKGAAVTARSNPMGTTARIDENCPAIRITSPEPF